ncbi:MAG: hypothetical protein LBM98_03490 [Oscillospiraceae bacterium]|nr:hypothetical protein [Oscillospiraceae bacterium]
MNNYVGLDGGTPRTARGNHPAACGGTPPQRGWGLDGGNGAWKAWRGSQ